MWNIKSSYIECNCHDPGHFVKFTLDNNGGEEFPTLAVEVHFIRHARFWKRLAAAFKYLFGFGGGNYILDEILLEKEQISKIRDLFNEFELARDIYYERN